jgi:hypothetical protein
VIEITRVYEIWGRAPSVLDRTQTDKVAARICTNLYYYFRTSSHRATIQRMQRKHWLRMDLICAQGARWDSVESASRVAR